MVKFAVVATLAGVLVSSSAEAAVNYTFELGLRGDGYVTRKVNGSVTLPAPAVLEVTGDGGSYLQFTSWDSCSFKYGGVEEACDLITFYQRPANTVPYGFDGVSVRSVVPGLNHQWSGTFVYGAFGTNGTYTLNDLSLPSNFYGRLRVSIPGVPEPGEWALMIGGFGLIGAAVRQRRSRALIGRPQKRRNISQPPIANIAVSRSIALSPIP